MSEKKTHNQFVEEMRIIQPTIGVLGMYEGARKEVKVICHVCGNE